MKFAFRSPGEKRRIIAIGESILATVIWASSFVLVKIGLDYIGPLTIAGLRYFLGFLVLLPFLVRRGVSTQSISKGLWLRLFAIGISAYAIGNGALFLGLKFLPATSVSFLMSLSPLFILAAGTAWLNETPTRWQVVGVVVSLIGSVMFFSLGLHPGEPVGIAIVLVGMIGFTFFGILGRGIAREKQVDTLTLTTIPLGIGGGILLLIALPVEGLPVLSPISIGIVLWLAVVNTAFAYVLYNHSLQVLTALEMNVVLNLAPLGTALLAWWFLGERLAFIQILGMIIMIVGVIIVQRVSMQSE